MVTAQTGLQNKAGLWDQYILPDLLWATSSPPGTLRPDFIDPKKYKAPSWSWASAQGQVGILSPEIIRGRMENILGLSMWVSYDLEWRATALGDVLSPSANGQVAYGELHIRGQMRKVEWCENSNVKGFQHNRQARSISDRWLPDYRRGTSQEIWALLIAKGRSLEIVRDARIDVGLILEPVEVESNHKDVFRRFGYFEQCYWSGDKYPIFAEGREVETRKIIII